MGRLKKPIKLITLDTETYNGLIGKLKRIAIYDGERVTRGYSFLDIEGELLRYKKAGYDVHIYIHNLEFDARKIPDIFDKKRIQWEKCFIINGKLATISCKDYTIHDSYKLLPSSLEKLSKDFNVSNKKVDLYEAIIEAYGHQYTIYNSKGEPDKNATKVNFLDKCDTEDPIYLEYLDYDVISLYEIIELLIDLTGIDIHHFVKRISTSSLSRYIFKNGFKGVPFKDPLRQQTDYEIMCQYNWRQNPEVEEFLRATYMGGRTEVFKPLLMVKGWHYDYNSLYPSEFDKEYPVGKPEYYNEPKLAEHYFNKWREDKIGLGFVSCSVYVPQQHIPPLPVKMGKLAFPCGYIYGSWSFEELEFAIIHCGVEIIEYREVCYFPNTYPVFKRFKDLFYQMKEDATEQGNESLRTLAKLILNVAYGYTGMSRDDKTQLRAFSDYEKYEDEIIFADSELGYIEIPAEINAEYIQVAIASTVTSRGRIDLLRALLYADQNGEAYYCDTDSVVCDVEFPPEWVHKTKIGMLDLEGRPDKAIFLRPKVYAELFDTETKVKFKGVTKDTQKEMTFDSYENMLKELVELKQDAIIVEKNRLTMRSIMYIEKQRIDIHDNRISNPNENIITGYEMRDKKMNLRTIEKRQINYEENYTKPWYFSSEEEFEHFTFNPPKKDIQFSMTKGGHK